MIMVIIFQSGATYFMIDGEGRGYQKNSGINVLLIDAAW